MDISRYHLGRMIILIIGQISLLILLLLKHKYYLTRWSLQCLFDLTLFQLCRYGSPSVEPVLSKGKCFCLRTQHSDAGEARTRGLSVSSQALYTYVPN